MQIFFFLNNFWAFYIEKVYIGIYYKLRKL